MNKQISDDVCCKHCGVHIKLVNGYSGNEWVHQPVGASFKDGEYRYCRNTAAEPPEKNPEIDILVTNPSGLSRRAVRRGEDHGSE